MPTVTAVVITRNEAAHVLACLATLAFADEIVVVDDASTDATAELARQAGARVIVHAHEGENWDLNKNVGMDAATGDWVLLIDADERVSAELAADIRQAIQDTPHAAFWLPRNEFYFGFHARHAASGAKVLRLFRRGAARFEGERLHVNPRVEGSIGELTQPLDHLAYATVREYVDKTNRYTDHEAATRYAAGNRAGWREIVLEPLKLFRYRYWVLKGYKDGMPGLVFSLVTSLYPLLQNLKLWELEARGRRSE
ncbi:MAG: putative Lipopolysaccharide core biosynthesis glycosyltransferase [Cyanobacteria bacterium RYN_339]|nr:putative Lipopolysaccharide core biosynthesis glycosyltransferase [Cyanobacteria bacterium RYN_339]